MDLLEPNLKNPLTHWYYENKFYFLYKAIFDNLDTIQTVVDVGAGSALFSIELARKFPQINFVAVDINYDNKHLVRGSKNLRYSRKLERGDFYILTDVLEHIENDFQFLMNLVKDTKSNSSFFLTVPASKYLWSNHDVYLKHFRRYTKMSLRRVILDSGLEIENISYLYSTLFLPAFFYRKIFGRKVSGSQMQSYSPFLNSVMTLLNKFERILPFRFPFGISLMAICTKQED